MYRFFIVQILLLVYFSSVKAFQISGVVSDSISLKPITNAKIQLKGYPLFSTLSDDSGRFVLNEPVSLKHNRTYSSVPPKFLLIGNSLNISNVFESKYSVSVFNLKGTRLYNKEKQVYPGATTVFFDLWHLPGVYFLKIHSDEFDEFIKINSVFTGYRTLNTVTSINSKNTVSSTGVFTIEVSKFGYVTKQVSTSNENANIGLVQLCIAHDSLNYIPLTVGDFRQFLLSDSSTLQWEIISTAIRSDGKTVLMETSQYGNEPPDTAYSYDDGQFWVICNSLDSAKDSTNNKIINYPFDDQRLALKIPSENQNWYQYDGDTTSSYRISKYYDSIFTALGPITNVFGFEMFNNKDDSLPIITVCFANNIGWIGTLNGNNADSTLGTIVYFRVNGIEKGTMIPKRDPKVNLLKKKEFGIGKSFRLLQGSTLKNKNVPMCSRKCAP